MWPSLYYWFHYFASSSPICHEVDHSLRLLKHQVFWIAGRFTYKEITFIHPFFNYSVSIVYNALCLELFYLIIMITLWASYHNVTHISFEESNAIQWSHDLDLAYPISSHAAEYSATGSFERLDCWFCLQRWSSD